MPKHKTAYYYTNAGILKINPYYNNIFLRFEKITLHLA